MTKTVGDAETAVERQHRIEQFLYREAELLDDRKWDEWLGLLTDDIDYRAPVRTTRELGADPGSEFSEAAFHFRETRSQLEARVNRFYSEHAWAVDPPARTRRFVTNVRIRNVDSDEFEVRSNLQLHHGQGDTKEMDLLSAERHDRIRDEGDGLKIARRRVLLDHTILPVKKLSFFI